MHFDFCRNHQADWRLAKNELHLGTKDPEGTSEGNIVKVTRITTRNVVIGPPRCEVNTSGIIQGKVVIPEVGIIQPQGKFCELYRVGVVAVIGKREGNSVPLRLINMQEDTVVLPKKVQKELFSPALIMPEEKIRRSSHQTSTMDPVKWFKQDVEELDTLDQEQFCALVDKYEEQFMTKGWPLGKTGNDKHSI